jgi:4-hydroxybenzoate polyprenyltransferase
MVFWITIFPAGLTLAILNGASNALNQITDIKADRISKPYRPIVKGIITKNEAKFIAIIMYLAAFSLSIYINLMFSVFVLLIIIFTVTYSLPPRVKDHLFLNQLWVGIPRGLLGILASWSLFGNSIQPLPLAIGLIAMFFLIGGSITKDITDSKADKKTGTHTLINTYGTKKAAFMALPFMFFPFAFIPMLIDSGILSTNLWLLTLLAIPGYSITVRREKPKAKTKYVKYINVQDEVFSKNLHLVFAFGFSLLTVIESSFL